MIYQVKYRYGDEITELKFEHRRDTPELSVIASHEDDVFRMEIHPNKSVQLISVTAQLDFEFMRDDSLLLNGYQSWTDTAECGIGARQQGLRLAPSFIRQKYLLEPYGDYSFSEYSGRRGDLHGFSYAYIRRNTKYTLFGSTDERSGFTEIRFNTRLDSVSFSKDCAGLVISAPYTAISVVMTEGTENAVFDRWFELMGVPLPSARPITGYTSWYNHYQNINENVIVQNITSAERMGAKFNVFQIDDGYQTRVGDWLEVDRAKFPHGIEFVAKRIRKAGMLPGLWLAPFACEYKSYVANYHKDWLLRDETGNPVKGGGNWGGFFVLDFYNPEVRDYLKKCFSTIIHEWGFKLLKLDFLYAAALVPDKYHTRGGVMFEVMDFLREISAGAQLLGCGVPLAAAFGRVDYCRIGCDVGLDYDDKPIMRLMHRERVSTKNSMRNTVFRRQLSGRGFINDPDVYLLRDKNIKLTFEQRATLAHINSLFGGVLFTSDDVSEYGSRQIAVFRSIKRRKRLTNVSVSRGPFRIRVNVDGESYHI